jgi:outer membrane PBP1 activator LpoA protein
MRRGSSFLVVPVVAALCACAQVPANGPAPRDTRPAPIVEAIRPAAPAPAPPLQQAPAEPAAPVDPAAPAQAIPLPLPGAPATGAVAPAAPERPAELSGTQAAPVPVALVLPGPATPFARAAEAVRLGFFAAHGAAGVNVAIQVVEIDDNLAQLRTALASAQKRGVRMAVGPLTRTLVNALGDGRVVAPLPVLTLNLPESDVAVAPESLAFGLAVEAEARQVVRLALRELPASRAAASAPRFLVLAGESPLMRRMAAAFNDALRETGERAVQIDVRVSYTILQTLTEQLAALRVDAVFCALDARETAFVRPRLPRELPVYATSQVNLGGAEAALLAPELDGVKFVDMPWLLEPDHPAVMVYPRAEAALSGELQRLYALGIDSYRLMLEWLSGRRAFELDGVTGTLRVERSRSPRVERWPSLAVFRSGRIERLEPGR